MHMSKSNEPVGLAWTVKECRRVILAQAVHAVTPLGHVMRAPELLHLWTALAASQTWLRPHRIWHTTIIWPGSRKGLRRSGRRWT